MLGRAMNTSDGPASGSSPGTLKTAGNITMPAVTATMVSRMQTCDAVREMSVSEEK